MPVVVDSAHLKGQPLVSSDGETVGTIDDVYIDPGSGEAEFLEVKAGRFRPKVHFVPVARINVEGGAVTVPYDKARSWRPRRWGSAPVAVSSPEPRKPVSVSTGTCRRRRTRPFSSRRAEAAHAKGPPGFPAALSRRWLRGSSMMVALAMPPPSHMVCRPYRMPLACMWCTSVVMSRAPEPPSGWPSAMAPPLRVERGQVGAGLGEPGQRDRAKASLTSKAPMSSMRQAGALASAFGRGRDRRR